MGVGRFICVALPFILTGASLVAIMVAMLAGVTDKSLDMFDVNTKNLSISTDAILSFEKEIGKRGLGSMTSAALGLNDVNVTASDLQLADSYKVSLWAYCRTTGTNTTCTKAKFNWAAESANVTEIEALARQKINYNNENVTIPKEISAAIKTFVVVNKWTEVVYIIAIVLTFLELVVGISGFFSRIGSCCTYILSGLSSTAIFAASLMATLESSIAVGAIKATAKAYGVDASLNVRFLATTWIAVAFSMAAGFFWLFTVCCCAAEHNKRTRRGPVKEKLIPVGAYQRVDDPHHHNNGHGAGGYNVPMHNVKPQQHHGAYEPYSHTAI